MAILWQTGPLSPLARNVNVRGEAVSGRERLNLAVDLASRPVVVARAIVAT